MNNATKFEEKNPTENGKFLSVIFLGYLVIISKRKFLELLFVNIRDTFLKNSIGVLSSFHNKKIHRDQRL